MDTLNSDLEASRMKEAAASRSLEEAVDHHKVVAESAELLKRREIEALRAELSDLIQRTSANEAASLEKIRLDEEAYAFSVRELLDQRSALQTALASTQEKLQHQTIRNQQSDCVIEELNIKSQLADRAYQTAVRDLQFEFKSQTDIMEANARTASMKLETIETGLFRTAERNIELENQICVLRESLVKAQADLDFQNRVASNREIELKQQLQLQLTSHQIATDQLTQQKFFAISQLEEQHASTSRALQSSLMESKQRCEEFVQRIAYLEGILHLVHHIFSFLFIFECGMSCNQLELIFAHIFYWFHQSIENKVAFILFYLTSTSCCFFSLFFFHFLFTFKNQNNAN